jgi:CBS domain-containing protein
LEAFVVLCRANLNMDLIRTLKETEPFKNFPATLIAELESAAIIKSFSPQVYIFKQNDPPSGYLYVIQDGLVEIVALAPGGIEMVVDYRKSGSFFGSTPFLANEPYTAGARTVRKTVCYLLPDELLTEVAKRYPQLTDSFTRAIVSRIRGLYSDMVSEHSQNALTQLEVYPFQKRLSEIMTPKVVTCHPTVSVSAIAGRMVQEGVEAVLVGDRDDPAYGIITEHDLVAKVLANPKSTGLTTKASTVMTPNPFTMSPDTYMYEAAAFMVGHNIKHLPVQAEEMIVGMVTLRDLMVYRSQKSMLLVGGVKDVQTIKELARIKDELVKIAKAFMSEARSPIETMEILSYLHRCILRRGFEIVLQDFQLQGMTAPDIRYCFFLMGSGGRKEMLLGPDQDHGFIFENYPDERQDEVESFFVPFAETLVTAFADIGYPLCKGQVMVNNPLWRGRLKDWGQRLEGWVKVPEPQRVRYSNNFFDYLPLVGDASLCLELRQLVQKQIREFPPFLYHLMELNFKHKVPLGLMGGFSLEKGPEHKGEVPTKQTGSLFIVDCIRIFHLEQQLDATTTIDRLERLVDRKIFNQETAEHLKAAFQAFTFLRLRQEIALVEQGRPPSHYLDPNRLNNNEQDLLKEAFRAASKLQDSTRRHFARLVN